MQWIWLAALLTTVATPVAAATCTDGDPAVISVQDWKLTKVDGIVSGIDIDMTFQSHATKPFRMVDATFYFEDVLGRRISSFVLKPDVRAAPGETFTTGQGYSGTELNRVLEMNRADVVVYICTKAIVFEDGTIDRAK